MTDELDVVRPPVRVGDEVAEPAGHPAIDARSLIASPVPRASVLPPPRRPLRPPDPLGVLDPHDPVLHRALDPAERPGRSRWLAGSAAVALAVVALGVAVVATARDDRSGDGAAAVAVAGATAPSTVAPALPGTLRTTGIEWGPAPGVCPEGAAACYVVGVELEDYPPGATVDVACVVPAVAGPGPVAVTVDDRGGAAARVPCAESRSARSLDVTVDGTVAATVDLPTTVVPTPTVTVAPGRPVTGEPGCSAAACRFLDVTLAGFEPGATVTVTCHGASAGAFASHDLTIGPDGTATESSCFFGYAGEEVWVDADGVRSPTLVWPP